VLFTKRFVGGLLLAATLTTGFMTAEALRGVGTAATASTRAVRVDPPQAGPNTSNATNTGDATAIVGLINTERARAGLAPLVWHDQLTAAALAHSTDMASMNRMTHTGSDGSDGGQRLTRAGFVWRAWGENVAAGYATVQSVFSGWMASAGHRAQILGDYAYMGLAAAASSNGTVYWTLDFAR
jgi:uncharacterized protein YkwD